MSQSVLIEIAVVGVVELVQAIVAAGVEYRQSKQFHTHDGATHEVDYVATDADGVEVGIRVDPKTKKATFVAQDGAKGKALANRIAQRYAYSRVTEDLKRKGYEIGKEQVKPDGSIQLVFSRWR